MAAAGAADPPRASRVYRALDLADIEVGRQVTYIRTDPSSPHISTTIVEGQVLDGSFVEVQESCSHIACVCALSAAVGEGPGEGAPAAGKACSSAVVDEGETVNDAEVNAFLQKDVAP